MAGKYRKAQNTWTIFGAYSVIFDLFHSSVVTFHCLPDSQGCLPNSDPKTHLCVSRHAIEHLRIVVLCLVLLQ